MLLVEEEKKVQSQDSRLIRQQRVGLLFIISGLLFLVTGITFGLLGGLQYLFPGLLKQDIPFNKVRPLHVTLVLSFITSVASGGIYYYVPRAVYSVKLAIVHYALSTLAVLFMVISFLNGYFSGREYLEYPPLISLFVSASWLCFAINFFGSIRRSDFKKVYFWMWSTGIVFFMLTYLESYLWMFPFFRDNIVRDITVQWKSLGAMVGSWNMLIYGTAFYLMDRIAGNENLSAKPVNFFFYFLGLTNLMFNWGHHTYIVPAASYVRYISYSISMTELLILGNIILNWRRSLGEARRNFNKIPFRFLSAADGWIFLNLLLAILISVPAINKYSHGTHITVAHSMGATIGINTMILFASMFFIAFGEKKHSADGKVFVRVFWLLNGSLFVFWISLLCSGVYKSIHLNGNNFIQVMNDIRPFFYVFVISGALICVALFYFTLRVINGSRKKLNIMVISSRRIVT